MNYSHPLLPEAIAKELYHSGNERYLLHKYKLDRRRLTIEASIEGLDQAIERAIVKLHKRHEYILPDNRGHMTALISLVREHLFIMDKNWHKQAPSENHSH